MFSLVFYRYKQKEMVKREKLENNTAYMQLQLPSMQTERTGKTLELSQELLNEQKMGGTLKCSIHFVYWYKCKDFACLCLKTKGLRSIMYTFLLLKQIYAINIQFSFSQHVAPSI